jgi:hypothetical protein
MPFSDNPRSMEFSEVGSCSSPFAYRANNLFPHNPLR